MLTLYHQLDGANPWTKEEHIMSVVIIGGHDRMVRQYKEICENHKYKAKVFTQMKTGLDKLIGRPDLLILFTNTVSHKMVRCVLDEVDENRTDIVRCLSLIHI